MAIEKLNPGSARDARPAERKRIPMSVPVQRLEAPEIPGHHLHWFVGSQERLQRAIDGGYEFVDERELKINNVSLGGDSTASGNTDMGSRVSVISGQELGKDGQPTRLILMKIKQEWSERGGVVTLLEIRANDAEIQDRLVLLLFPGGVLLKQLPAHVRADPIGACLLLAVRIRSEHLTLHNPRATHDCRVGAGMKLHRGNRHQRKCDIGTACPGEGLVLLDLQGQVHPDLIPLHPVATRLHIALVAGGAFYANASEVIVAEAIAEIR